MKKYILSIMIVFLAFISLSSINISAATYGNLTYTVSNGEAKITDCNTSAAGRVSVPSYLGGYPVTSIGAQAFYFCDDITSISLPSTVKSIGSKAFWYCSGLTSVNIPASVTVIESSTFEACSALCSITVPEGVVSIGNSAFSGCRSLTAFTVPENVTSIGSGAFSGCTALESIEVHEDNTVYSSCSGVLFDKDKNILVAYPAGSSGDYTVEDGVSVIGDGAFENCDMLTGISLPLSLKTIGASSFARCDALTNVTIPSGVKYVGASAFYLCTKLEYVSISDGVEEIGGGAFKNCDKLTTVDLPDSITSIGGSAFYDSDALVSIDIPEGVKSLGYGVFYSCNSLESVKIPSTLESAGEYCFYYCINLSKVHITDVGGWLNIDFHSSYGNPMQYADKLYLKGEELKYVVIPDSIDHIPSRAFYNCSTIERVYLHNDVKEIGASAFFGCVNLVDINIPDSVTSIGNSAFSGCTTLAYNTYGNAHYLGNENNRYRVLVRAIDAEVVSVDIHTDTVMLYAEAFRDCTRIDNIVIPDGVESLGYGAFWGCESLDTIIIPDSVTEIGTYAFLNCVSLKSVTISPLVTSIGYSVFSGCTSLSWVNIGVGVKEIAEYAFRNCTGLKSMIIPQNVTSIALGAFSGCCSLESITLPFIGPSSVVSEVLPLRYSFGYIFGNNSYSGGVYTQQYWYSEDEGWSEEVGYYIPSSLRHVTLTNTDVPRLAFANCKNLISVTFCEDVQSFGRQVFYNCSPTVNVYKDTAAYSYALSNSLEYKIITEDIDSDGEFTNTDITLMLRYFSGWDISGNVGDVDLISLDVTCDGKVNNRDVIACIRKFVGW